MKLTPRLLVSLGLVTAAALVAAPLTAKEPADARNAQQRILDDVIALAAPEMAGRGSGTEGCEMAERYLIEGLKEAGALPGGAEIGGVRTYIQPFTFTKGVKVDPATRGSVAAHAPGQSPASFELKTGTDMTPLGFSGSGQVKGEVVFLGYGLIADDPKYDDFAGLDLKGKVALVIEGIPQGETDETKEFWGSMRRATNLRFKALRARERGAIALVVVARDSAKPGDDPALASVRGNRTGGDAGIVVIDLLRSRAEELFAAAGEDLGKLQSEITQGMAPKSRALPALMGLDVKLHQERLETSNVLALIEGSDPKLKRQVIAVGAHYDHLGLGSHGGSLAEKPGIHYGADDNASGSAVVVELARRFAKERPRRSVLLCLWSAEELGLLGSAWFVKNSTVPLDRIVAYVNLDMVGRLRENKLTISGTQTSTAWDGLLDETLKGFGLSVKRDPEGFGPSDYSSFYGAKVPVLGLFTGTHAEYHTPGDTIDTVNPEGMATIARLTRQLVLAIDQRDKRPPYNKTKGDPHGGQMTLRGPSVYFGTIPDYADTDGPGVRLSGVRAGGPAEKAGVVAGDRIVRFDGSEVRDVYDYTNLLFAKKPGDVVEVVIVRDGEKIVTNATLGKKGGKPKDPHGTPAPHGDPGPHDKPAPQSKPAPHGTPNPHGGASPHGSDPEPKGKGAGAHPF